MKSREEKISSRLKEASTKLKEAELKSQKYEKKIIELEKQKSTWLEEAKKEAESFKLELIQEARNEVEKVRDKWMKAVETEKKMFLEELEEQSFQKVMDIVENIVTDLADITLEKQAVNRFISQLKEMKEKDRRRMTKAVDADQLEVATAFPIEEEDREQIDATIRQLLDRKDGCRYKHDPELGFGIEVRSNGWKIGWNMKGYLEELRSEVKTVLGQLEDDT
ncbi:ATP synthase subunit b [Fodinibius salicampi]